MEVTISTPGADDFDEMSAVDARNFGYVPTAGDVEESRNMVDLDRFRIARSKHGDIVGLGGTWALELTLPGGSSVPMAGVTWVSVSVSHRRQGLLSALMSELHDDVADRGEPVLGLMASEGGIYGRYDYGVASHCRSVTIDRRRVEFRDGQGPTPGAVRIVDPTAHIDDLEQRWDRFRRTQVGEINRPPGWFAMRFAHAEKNARVGALHDDGFAIWTIAENWDDGHPKHVLDVADFAASTPQAHSDLWKTILSVDLVGEVRAARAVGVTDRLPHLLTDGRLVRTVDSVDSLWLCPLDVQRLFGERTYRTDDELVLGVDGASYAISPDGCERTDRQADVETTTAGAGSLLLGAVSATELALGDVAVECTPDALGRADALLGWEPQATLRTGF